MALKCRSPPPHTPPYIGVKWCGYIASVSKNLESFLYNNMAWLKAYGKFTQSQLSLQ